MENQDYKIPMKKDDFSILEDKIYKLFIEIMKAKENTRENLELDYSKEEIFHY